MNIEEVIQHHEQGQNVNVVHEQSQNLSLVNERDKHVSAFNEQVLDIILVNAQGQHVSVVYEFYQNVSVVNEQGQAVHVVHEQGQNEHDGKEHSETIEVGSSAETDNVKTLADHLARLEARYEHEIQALKKEVSRLGKVVLQKPISTEHGDQLSSLPFTSYLSSNFDGQHFGTGHTVKYDVIETNEGNGYNKFTGTFIAPSDGLYAFSWTIIAAGFSNNHERHQRTPDGMARWKHNFEPDIRNLITLFTGFSEEEDNFKICFQFADSNIKYHRFLSVDSHKVTQSLNGVIEKCTIHSEQRKADTLKTLTDEFLETPVFEGKKEGKTDTHYGLLSLLLHLAESPTHCSYDGSGLVLQTEEPKDDFDWTAFLLDGEYRPLQVYDDLEVSISTGWPLQVYDDLESDSEEETLTEDDDEEDKKITKDQDYRDSSGHIDDVQPSDTGLAWLQKNLVVQYWRGHGCAEEGSEGHDSCNLTRDWEAYKQASNPLYGEPGHVLITETMLIREVLWMLFGVKDSFIFVYTGEKFLIRDSIVLSHLTEKMVDSILYDLTKYGGYVQKLQKFEQEVTSCSYHANSDDNIMSQTYQSFQSAVALGFLDSFKKEITRIEKIIVKQEETITLSSLHATLKPWLHKLDILYSVYVKGIKEAEWLPSNYQKSSHLISVIYEAITEFDALGEFSKDVVDLLLPLWIQTTKPYIDIIDNWITNGILCDPRLEFIVRRNESVKSLDEKFWEIAFTIHVPEDDPSKSKTHDQTDTLDDTSTFSEFFSHWAPQFLQPVLVEIILAGKSMELLQDLGKLAEVVGHKGDITYKATPLYTMFLDSLQDMLGTKNCTKEFQQEKTTDSYSLFSPHIEQQMKIKGIYDPLLRINFEAIFSVCVNNLERSSLLDTSYNDWLTVSLVRDGLQPIDQLLQKCLYPHIKQKYVHVCSKLVQILKEEYHLMEYLATMRIRLNEHWRDALF
ncbi:TUBGCP5 [Mytilus coruscus]|uniref:Gamma-tubulin complex component n=1 Tax=Mytilus coruscus TaxID=42192 RepID=A0A6J8C2M6_MYTCO|nr:TUBGCP5 [Mytilus coruscus]